MNLLIAGNPAPRPKDTPIFWMQIIDPAYLHMMRIPLVRGCEFTEQDSGTQQVAIINETMALRFWPDADPLGKRFGIRDTWWTMVGIVGDVKFISLAFVELAEGRGAAKALPEAQDAATARLQEGRGQQPLHATGRPPRRYRHVPNRKRPPF
jgi:hypothetical protein